MKYLVRIVPHREPESYVWADTFEEGDAAYEEQKRSAKPGTSVILCEVHPMRFHHNIPVDP